MAVRDEDNLDFGPMSLAIDGADIGFCEGGKVLTLQQELVDRVVDEHAGPIDKIYAGGQMRIEVRVGEITRAALVQVWPAGQTRSGNLFYPTNAPGHKLSDNAVELTLTRFSDAAGSTIGNVQKVEVYKAINAGELGIGFNKEGRVFEVTFESLADPTKGIGREHGYIALA